MEFAEQPGAREGPVALGRGFRDFKDLARLFEGESREEAELDQLGVDGVGAGEGVQGDAELFGGVRGIRAGRGDGFEFGGVDAKPASAVAGGAFPASLVDENLAHGLRGGGVEVGLAVPGARVAAGDFQPGFMHQGGGLKRLSREFRGEATGSEGAQLIVNLRQERVVGGVAWRFVVGAVGHGKGSGYSLETIVPRRLAAWRISGRSAT